MSKQKIALLILLLVALTLVAAGRVKQNDSATVWGEVLFKGGPCPGLAHYVSPCPDCKVWLRWLTPIPDCLPGPLRLDGYVTDEKGGCQVLNVTAATCCLP